VRASPDVSGARRLVIGISVAACLLLSESTSFNYTLAPLIKEFSATADQTNTLRLIPNIGAVIVVFLAGVFGARWGERRVLLWSIATFIAGGLVSTLALNLTMIMIGSLLLNMGRSVVFVLAIALIGHRLTDREERASGFATWGATLPVAYIVMPVIAGLLVDNVGWRSVAVIWPLAGAVALGMVLWGVPPDGPRRQHGELLTPALATVALTALIPAINTLGRSGITMGLEVNIGVAIIAVIALGIALRRLPQPTLSIAALRNGGAIVLLAVVVLFNFANLWFYLSIAFQYVYGLSALGTALIIIPTQVMTILAARLAGRLIKAKGITFAGTSFLLIMAIALVISCFIEETSPIWWAAAVLALFGAANSGASVPLTNAVMDSSPRGQEGSASSFRSAASSIGSAISVTIVTIIVFGTMSTSLVSQAEQAGLTPAQARTVVAEFENGAKTDQLVGSFVGLSVTRDDIRAAERSAYIEGVHSHGIAGATVTFVIAGLFALASRRQQRHDRFEKASSSA